MKETGGSAGWKQIKMEGGDVEYLMWRQGVYHTTSVKYILARLTELQAGSKLSCNILGQEAAKERLSGRKWPLNLQLTE